MNYLFSIMCIIVVIYSFTVIFKRIINKSNKKISKNDNKVRYTIDKKESLKIFIFALSFRIFIFLIGIVIFSLFIDNTFTFDNIISSLVKWDASNYIRIAEGYSSYIENGYYTTLVFFPLYSWILKIVDVFIHYPEISGLIVSSVAYSIACIFIYKLVCMDYGKLVAKKVIILISISPFAFFFGTIMSESIFLLFSTITLYYIRKHKWFLVGIFGCFASLSRLIGVFLIIPAIVEIIEEYHIIKNIKDYKYVFKIIKNKLLPCFLLFLGIIIYLYINFSLTNDWFYFLKIQKNIWNQGYAHFFQIFSLLINNIKIIDKVTSFAIFIPELVTVIIMYIILILGLKKTRTMYLMWFLIYILINTSLTWPMSIGRYFTCVLTPYIIIANWCNQKDKYYIAIVIISSILYAIFLTAYICGKLIM